MADADKDSLKRALASGRGRSPVYRWLRQRHDQLAEAMREIGGRPNWRGLADLMMEQGVRDGRGHPPTAATVREQFRKVQRDMKAKGSAPRARPVGSAVNADNPAPPDGALGDLQNKLNKRSGR